jgi:hypothetical protein
MWQFKQVNMKIVLEIVLEIGLVVLEIVLEIGLVVLEIVLEIGLVVLDFLQNAQPIVAVCSAFIRESASTDGQSAAAFEALNFEGRQISKFTQPPRSIFTVRFTYFKDSEAQEI